jgi:soluble cytochrome b562
MGGGGPAPEPDYTQERAGFAATKAAEREQQAKVYNQSVTDYNNRLQTELQNARGLGQYVNTASINDVAGLDWLDSKINEHRSAVDGLSFNTPAPNWSSGVQSPYGAVTVDVPGTLSVNSNTKNSIDSVLSGFSNTISDLRSKRAAEEARVNDFRSGLIGGATELNANLANLDYSNQSGIDAAQQAINDLNTQKSTFSSQIAGQLYPGGFTQANAEIARAQAQLQAVRAARAAEERRIEEFRSGLRSRADQARNTAYGLTIADLDEMNNLQRSLDDIRYDASGFSSTLGANFSNTLGTVDTISGRLGQLFAERAAEEQRISAAEAQQRQRALSLAGMTDNATMYDLGVLNNISRQAETGLEDISGFESLLEYDFGNAQEDYTEAQSLVEQLMGQRQEALTGYDTEMDALLSSLEGAGQYDEDAFLTSMSDFEDVNSGLSRFIGADATDLQFEANDGYEAANQRLEDLFGLRDDFESDLQTELANLGSVSFNELSDFDQYDARATELRTLLDEMGASQASDELTAFNELLGDNRSRLVSSMQTEYNPTASSQNRAQELLAQFNNGLLTPEQYLAMLAGIEDEERAAVANTGGFSGNILRL